LNGGIGKASNQIAGRVALNHNVQKGAVVTTNLAYTIAFNDFMVDDIGPTIGIGVAWVGLSAACSISEIPAMAHV
jgi:hypothetical protein